MARKKRTSPRRKPRAGRPAAAGAPEDALQGPPARETTVVRSDRERAASEELERYTATGPGLTGGDTDADWQRADQVGEEAVGGSVSTPDQDVVDELGDALGVPQAPDAEFRPSAEILEGRDRRRWEQEP
jgi:hypothetical protein